MDAVIGPSYESSMAHQPDLESGQTLDDELLTDRDAASAPSTIDAVAPTQQSAEVVPHSIPPKSQLMTVARSSYRFGTEVARGGLGRIVQARDLRLNRDVAIKELIRPSLASEARFLREIQATVKLQHPNIVAIHEAGRWPDGQLFYAMNFVAGKTLLEVIGSRKSLSSRMELLPTILDITEAIAFAHSEGVVHRDLKPANVLVGRFGETVVIDWGLAKLLGKRELRSSESDPAPEAGVTRVGLVVGTPPYMPPEQAAGKDVDERCDVYALGAILYHALCGHAPYAEPSEESILDRIRQGPPIPLGELEPELPPDLLAIVEKAMSRDPAQRYANGAEMAQELSGFTKGRLVRAYSYRFRDLLRRFVQRNAAAVGTAAVALVVMMAAASYGVMQVRGERDLAQQSERTAKKQLEIARARELALTVTRSMALTESDPTLAVAYLKHLDEPIPGAASVAAKAEEYGVARWVLRGHSDSVNCVDVSPDGTQIVSGGEDHTVVVWNFGTPEGKALTHHTDRVTDCAFSPAGDLIATASYDGHVALLTTDTLLEDILPAQGGAVKAIAFSRDGEYLAIASNEDTIGLWHVPDRNYTAYPAHNVRWPWLAFSSPGRWLSGPHAGRFRLWRLDGSFIESPPLPSPATHAQMWEAPNTVVLGTEAGGLYEWNTEDSQLQEIAELGSEVMSLSTSTKEPGYAAAATMTGDVYQVDLTTREAHRLGRHRERVQALAVSPEQRFIASGSWDRHVRVFDVTTDANQTFRGHTDVVSDLAFTPDERFLISASWDKTLRVWPLRNELHDKRSVFLGHSVGVHSVRFSPDGNWIASGGHDDTVRLWNIHDKTERVLRGHTDHIYRVIFSPDGRHVASSSDDRTVRIWSTRDARLERVLRGHEADVEELAYSPDGEWLVSASEDHTARVWNTTTTETHVLYHDHDVAAVVFSPDGSLLATGSRAGHVRLFETERFAPKAVLSEHDGEVHAVAFSPDGRWLASADKEGSLVLRELATERTVRWNSLPGAHGIVFSPDGQWLAIAGATPHLWLCEVKTSMCEELKAHRSIVRGMHFTPDSKYLATGGGEGVLYLWDVRTHEYRIFEGHHAPIFDLDVSPREGNWIATASADASVRLWPRIPPPSSETLLGMLDEMTAETVAEKDPEAGLP